MDFAASGSDNNQSWLRQESSGSSARIAGRESERERRCLASPPREKSLIRFSGPNRRAERHTYVADVFYAKFSGITATTSIIFEIPRIGSRGKKNEDRRQKKVEEAAQGGLEYTREDSGRESGEVEG